VKDGALLVGLGVGVLEGRPVYCRPGEGPRTFRPGITRQRPVPNAPLPSSQYRRPSP
jgi:hypothetical protein